MHNKWYWLYKYVLLGPIARVWSRPKYVGGENVPMEGPAIMASNHQSVYDSFAFPLVCPRQIVFPAKSEYFTKPGLKGRFQKWFFSSAGQIPIYRQSESAGDALTETATKVFEDGGLFGIYPEGTRAPDERIYKGRTGMARVAMASDVPVVPVGMLNTGKANPIGTTLIRPVKVEVRIGKPIHPREWAKENGYDPDSREVMRPFTDYVMHALSELTGYPYVDAYASDVKKSLEAGKGYPAGTEPDLKA